MEIHFKSALLGNQLGDQLGGLTERLTINQEGLFGRTSERTITRISLVNQGVTEVRKRNIGK